ncbi:unnamed protein product, partial [Symbiodinium pilosum]
AKMNRVKIEATQYLKAQGVDTTVLPRPAAISNRAVYSSINRCVFQIDLGTTFVMKAAILLGDSCIDIIGRTDNNALCVGLWAGVPGGVLGMSAAGANLQAAFQKAFGK